MSNCKNSVSSPPQFWHKGRIGHVEKSGIADGVSRRDVAFGIAHDDTVRALWHDVLLAIRQRPASLRYRQSSSSTFLVEFAQHILGRSLGLCHRNTPGLRDRALNHGAKPTCGNWLTVEHSFQAQEIGWDRPHRANLRGANVKEDKGPESAPIVGLLVMRRAAR